MFVKSELVPIFFILCYDNKKERLDMQKEDILKYLADIKSELIVKGIDKIGLFGSFANIQ